MVLFKTNLTDKRLLLILTSSLTFVVLSSFTGNLFQSVYADSNYGAAGDWGCTSNTDATVSNMDAKDPERVFGLGDYSYASTGTCWFNKIAPIDSITKIAFGNHEDESSEGFSGYMSHFGLSQTYYAYTHDVVRVIVMDTDVADPSDSAQISFVQSELQSASTNPSIKWIIVYLHKPFYTSPNTCGSSSCSNTGSAAAELRDNYHAMFDQYGVDLVLQGHVHNYQRTFTLKYDSGSPSSPTITSNNANTYTEGNGAVFAVVGTGGVNFHALSGKASFTSSQQDDFFGQLDVKTTDNGNKLEGRFYRNGDNAILDSFSITKAPNSPPVAKNQIALTGEDTAKPIVLSASDSDGNILSYSVVTPPQHGTLSGSFAGQLQTYTPTTGYTGSDSFTFRANDGTANSNTATVSITVVDPASCPANLLPIEVAASGNDGNIPQNAFDNNLNTRWSNPGASYILGDLGSLNEICSVDIGWYLGNQRQYLYVLATSTDLNTWKDAFSGTNIGTIQINTASTANQEKNFIPPTNARYFGIIAKGFTNDLVGITEIDIFGSSASLTGSYQYDPSLSLSGPK